MKQAYSIASVVWLILLVQPTAYGGKLSRAREAVRSQPKPASKSAPSRSDDEDDDDDDGGVLSGISAVVRSVSNESSSDKRQRRERRRVNDRRPHRSPRRPRISFHASSNTWCEPTWNEPVVTETIIYPEPIERTERVYVEPTLPPVERPVFSESVVPIEPWRKRLEVLYGNDLEDVNAFGLGLLLQQPTGIGFDTNLRLFREDYLGQRDHLWLGDANLTFELINESIFQARAGIGLGWLTDAYGGNAGLNLTLGADLFLTDSVVMSGEVDFGSVGDADLLHARATVGYVIDHVELFAGYDHYDIGGVEINSLMSGIRFRF